MPRLIDLSHTVEHGMVTYKGLPAPIICDFLSREAVRAHLRARHRVPYREDRDGGEHRHLSRRALPPLRRRQGPRRAAAGERGRSRWRRGARAGLERGRAIEPGPFRGRELRGQAPCWSTPAGRGTGAPSGTSRATRSSPRDAAAYLRDRGAALVGIDSLNIDDISGGERPVHSTLLKADIPIVEHMTRPGPAARRRLPLLCRAREGERFGTFPVRAFALLG